MKMSSPSHQHARYALIVPGLPAQCRELHDRLLKPLRSRHPATGQAQRPRRGVDTGIAPARWLAEHLPRVDLILAARSQGFWPELIQIGHRDVGSVPPCLAGSHGQRLLSAQLHQRSQRRVYRESFSPQRRRERRARCAFAGTLRGPARADGQWRGTASHWRISGGDLSALDLADLPLALEARWEGTLDVTLRGQRCLSSQGGLTAARIALLSPTIVELGHGRLNLDCTGPMPRLLLEIEDGRALSIRVAMTLAGAGGEAHVQGVIDEHHPLSQWRRRLSLDAPGERLDVRFRW